MKNKFWNCGTTVKAGELLLTEEPFAFVLSSKEKANRCDNCLEKVKVLKCSGCQFVHYCGRTCQKEAWTDHKWECSNLKHIAPKVIPDAARMLAKIIHRMSKRDGHIFKSYYTPTSFRMWKDLMSQQQITIQALSALCTEDLKELIPQTGPRVLFTRCWSTWKNEFSQTGCSENNNNISLSLMIDFEEHYKDHANNLFSYFPVIKLKIIDCFKKQTLPSRDTICQEIINLADYYSDLKADKKRMDHFSSLIGVLNEFLRDTSLPNTVELMGMYGRMVINSFTILDVEMNSIGTGIYLGCSIVDHSCTPNAVATFDGKIISIRALYDMPSLDWNQIRISYIDLMKTPYERQTELLTSYYFLCQCDQCSDENQIKTVHAAKCLNLKCENPVQVHWKENCQLARKPTINTNGEIENGVNGKIENGIHGKIENGKVDDGNYNENGKINAYEETNDEIIHCSECGTKYPEENIDNFKKTMEFTEMHLHDMKGASVAYVDVCKYCLAKQDGVLHPLNVMHAQTLDHAFDALIQVQIWEQACLYAERLIPCFRFYYGDRHPLLGLLHLKYGKILLYKMELQTALEQFKSSERILKITHGERHPLYKEELLPLLRQSIMEQQ